MSTIMEVENSTVQRIEDDYAVSVRLKDDSVYAFAPRRFAHAERLEIRQIIDDLLERDIVQPSVSLLCSRSPGSKKERKNETLR